MTDTMIKVALFLGDHGEKFLLRELIAEREREVKQARAEVLAACIEAVRFPKECKHDSEPDICDCCRWEWERRVCSLLGYPGLKPAASDLEELLREAELEVIKTSPECWHFNTETEREFIDRYFAWRGRRIERLEKARATGGKG